jgi:hypothetical protein
VRDGAEPLVRHGHVARRGTAEGRGLGRR